MVSVRLLGGAKDSLPLPSVHSHITLRPSSAQAGPFSHVSSEPQAPSIMPGMEWALSKVTVCTTLCGSLGCPVPPSSLVQASLPTPQDEQTEDLNIMKYHTEQFNAELSAS